MDTLSFIKKAKEVHGDKYDYSLSKYIGSHNKITIICPIHGIFEQQATCHINRKSICPKCAKINRKNNSKKTLKEKYHDKFFKLAPQIHNNKFNYSKVKFKNHYDEIIIICNKHGEFKQKVSAHLKGSGCPKCLKENKTYKLKYTLNEFIKLSNNIHNNKYDYSSVNYKGQCKKITIICPIHGKFSQLPSQHLQGRGCIKCGHDKTNKQLLLNTKNFIDKAITTHGNKYNYKNSSYNNYNTTITITCPIHGNFNQTPHNHIKGHGCPKCIGIKSKAEDEIEQFINSQNIKTIRNSRNIIPPYEIDIFIPNFNLGIEYHGIYWHSYFDNNNKYKLSEKYEKCANKKIKLLQFTDFEWINNKNIIISMINNALKLSNKIHARKCKIKLLDNNTFNNFMKNNHLQGTFCTSIKIGLLYEDKLVSAIGFNKHKIYSYELTRYANILNTTIQGGASKLLNYFIKNYNPQTILTYANKRYSNGNLYKQLNFKHISVTKPNYFYVKGNKLYSRQFFQKHKLMKRLTYFNQKLTESENMFNNGYKKFWDAGNLKFLLTIAT